MFPHTYDMPSLHAKGLRHEPVACPIGCQFLIPELPIIDWHVAMLRAAMPETAIHKNNNSLTSESEIRLAKQGLIPSPSGDAVLAK